MLLLPPFFTLFPYTTLFRSFLLWDALWQQHDLRMRNFYYGDYGAPYEMEEHTSELQSQFHLVCRLLLEKKKKNTHTKKRILTKKDNQKQRDDYHLKLCTSQC